MASHPHAPTDAERYGIHHGDTVSVATRSTGRDLIFGEVMVRVKGSYLLEMHRDTDKANAAQINRGDVEAVILSGQNEILLRRVASFDPV